MQLWLVLAHAILMQVVTTIMRPTISYRALENGAGPGLLGVVAASYTAAPLLLALLAGRITDRRGERLVLTTGTALILVAAATLLRSDAGVGVLVGGSVLLGLGQLFSMLGEQSLVAGLAEPGGFDAAFGRFTFATSIGQGVGPAVVALLAGSSAIPDTHLLFVAAVAAAATMMTATIFLRSSPRTAVPSAEAGTKPGLRRALAVPGLGTAILVSLAVIASVDLLTVYLPLLGTERQIAASTVGGLLVVRALASMVSRLFLGTLVRRCGRTGLLVSSIALAAVAMAFLAVRMPVWTLGIIVVLVGLGLGFGQPLTMAWVAEAAPERMRATALSLRLTGNRLGQTVAPAAVGLVAASAGASGVFLVVAGGLGATSALVVGQSGSFRRRFARGWEHR